MQEKTRFLQEAENLGVKLHELEKNNIKNITLLV